MKDERLAEAIQEGWPEADVLLTSATVAYYRDGKLVPRLDEEIVGPAMRRGYARVWIAGASLGGMGALLYERDHPGKASGIVLFAPFLGDWELIAEIQNAGGARRWDPGPLPAEMNSENYQRQVWKMVKRWPERPELARRIWLAVGTDDSLVTSARLLQPQLLPSHSLELPGGHTWEAWRNGAREIFARIRAETY